MKKLIVMALSLLLLFGLAVTGWAAGTGLTVSDVTVENGETVYVSVILNETVTGDSMGISYTYDSEDLKAVPSLSTWSVSGLLKDFNNSNLGVWAASDANNLSGTVCVLAFKLRDGAKFTETAVSCTLTVQKDGKNVGTYSAQGTVSLVCHHVFGEWSPAGELGHSRSCSSCDLTQTESHTWDDGVSATKEGDPDVAVIRYTCSVCKGTKEVELPGSPVPIPTEPEPTVPEYYPTQPAPDVIQPIDPLPTAPQTTEPVPTYPSAHQPTGPAATQPAAPEATRPGQSTTDPVKGETPTQAPAEPSWNDYNQSGEGANTSTGSDVHDGHDHSDHNHDQVVDQPLILPAPADSSQQGTDETQDEIAHDHVLTEEDHVHTEPANEGSAATVIAVFATAAVLVAAGIVLYRRSKRK